MCVYIHVYTGSAEWYSCVCGQLEEKQETVVSQHAHSFFTTGHTLLWQCMYIHKSREEGDHVPIHCPTIGGSLGSVFSCRTVVQALSIIVTKSLQTSFFCTYVAIGFWFVDTSDFGTELLCKCVNANNMKSTVYAHKTLYILAALLPPPPPPPPPLLPTVVMR